MKKLLLCLLLAGTSLTQAAVIQFDLMGKGGAGLLASNEWSGGAPSTVNGTPGSGGEIGAGFSFDNVTKVLTLNFSWSGLQGATSGSVGSASGYHIHGPVTQPDAMAFTASVIHNISNNTAGGGAIPSYVRVNNANGTGSVTGTISNIPAGQEADLLAGRWYVNVHSALNGGGEIRGNLVQVPEPTTGLFLGLGLACGLLRRRK
jgi:hypothetical protein